MLARKGAALPGRMIAADEALAVLRSGPCCSASNRWSSALATPPAAISDARAMTIVRIFMISPFSCREPLLVSGLRCRPSSPANTGLS